MKKTTRAKVNASSILWSNIFLSIFYVLSNICAILHKDVPEDCGVDKKVLVDRVGEVLEEMLLSRYRREEEVEEDVTVDGDEPYSAETPEDIELVAAGTIGGQRPILVLDLRRTTSQETIATRVM